MPFASNKDVHIYYEVYGEGPPLVLVHANPFDHRLFTY
jgi:pimeloyl-ACP methyl ester carboxylesterase